MGSGTGGGESSGLLNSGDSEHPLESAGGDSDKSDDEGGSIDVADGEFSGNTDCKSVIVITHFCIVSVQIISQNIHNSFKFY